MSFSTVSESAETTSWPNTDHVVVLEHVSKTYRLYNHPRDRILEKLLHSSRHTPFRALNDINLTIGRGEKIGIIGRNGSGKSTLLQLIVGTLKTNEGVVRRKGRIAALLELGAGFNPEFTGRDNVTLNLSILGGPEQARDSERVGRIIAFADIGDYIDRPVKLYSSGMYLRLAFAVAIHVEADVIVIDEALAVGDFPFQARCLQKLDALSAEGKTIIFVSHDIAQVRRFCDRAVYLRKGGLVSVGDVASVCDAYFNDVNDGQSHNATIPARQIDSADFDAGELSRFALKAAHGRFGARQRAEILSVSVNGQSEETPRVAFGQIVEITIVYRVHEPAPNLTIAFYVVDVAAQPIIGSNTIYEQQRLIDAPGVGALTIRFVNRLRDGDYGLAVTVARFKSDAETEYEDYIPLAAHLHSLIQPNQKRWAFYSPSFELRNETLS